MKNNASQIGFVSKSTTIRTNARTTYLAHCVFLCAFAPLRETLFKPSLRSNSDPRTGTLNWVCFATARSRPVSRLASFRNQARSRPRQSAYHVPRTASFFAPSRLCEKRFSSPAGGEERPLRARLGLFRKFARTVTGIQTIALPARPPRRRAHASFFAPSRLCEKRFSNPPWEATLNEK